MKNDTCKVENESQLLKNFSLDEIDLDEMFYGESPDKSHFHKVLHKILNNISKL